jgi:hypothetical protein
LFVIAVPRDGIFNADVEAAGPGAYATGVFGAVLSGAE